MSKYTRSIRPWDQTGKPIDVDVYNVLEAFDVRCPAVAHAVKKLLCAGLRGDKSYEQDLTEAVQAITRAVTLARQRPAPGATPCPPVTA